MSRHVRKPPASTASATPSFAAAPATSWSPAACGSAAVTDMGAWCGGQHVGQGERAIVPPEIRRWNWGAFLLNWIWGVVNETYIAFLMFVPLVNVVMIFVLGAKGSEWAWRNERWRDVAHFQRVQRLWAIWGLVAWGAVIVILRRGSSVLFVWLFPRAEAYVMAVARLNAKPGRDQRARRADHARLSLGQHLDRQATADSAELSFSATGPKAHGTVYVDAIKSGGRWQLTRLDLVVADSGRPIDLRGGGGSPNLRRRVPMRARPFRSHRANKPSANRSPSQRRR